MVFCLLTGSFSGSLWGNSYIASFSVTENPISENSNWITGGLVGLDWTDVATVPGLAYGTESGGNGYDDASAVLAGDWGPDQMAQATVHTSNQDSTIWEEVELRLRTTITPGSITGYEINFRCTVDGSQYIQIVRWDGAFANFTYLNTTSGPGLNDGDFIMATIVGDVITVYVNYVPVLQAIDDTYTRGSPGMGFFLSGTSGVNTDYGFTSFAASDENITGGTAPVPIVVIDHVEKPTAN
jgi:hypothetical protein